MITLYLRGRNKYKMKENKLTQSIFNIYCDCYRVPKISIDIIDKKIDILDDVLLIEHHAILNISKKLAKKFSLEQNMRYDKDTITEDEFLKNIRKNIYYNIGSNIDVIVEEKKNKLIEQELEFIDNDDKDYYCRKAFISVILAILTLLFLFFVLDNFGNFK